MEKAKGAAEPGTKRGTTPSPEGRTSQKLSDLGISKNQSSKWQQLGRVPEKQFEAALASYARQAEDETLLKHAMRIQGRAVRRAGELLKEFDVRQGQNLPATKSGGTTTFSAPTSRREAGEQAGMSRDQQVTAVRVANIPPHEFESAVEAANPPTVTALAEMGKKQRPTKVIDHLGGRDP